MVVSSSPTRGRTRRVMITSGLHDSHCNPNSLPPRAHGNTFDPLSKDLTRMLPCAPKSDNLESHGRRANTTQKHKCKGNVESTNCIKLGPNKKDFSY